MGAETPGSEGSEDTHPQSPEISTSALLLLNAVSRVIKYGSQAAWLEARAAKQAASRAVTLLLGATLFLITAWFVLNAAVIWIGIVHFEIGGATVLLGSAAINVLLGVGMVLAALRQWRAVTDAPTRLILKMLGRR